jgi:hypothetical protein
MNVIFKRRIDRFSGKESCSSLAIKNIMILICDILRWESRLIDKKTIMKIKKETLEYCIKIIKSNQFVLYKYFKNIVNVLLIFNKVAVPVHLLYGHELVMFNIGFVYKKDNFILQKWFIQRTKHYVMNVENFMVYSSETLRSILGWKKKKISIFEIGYLFDGDIYGFCNNMINFNYSENFDQYKNFRINVYCNYMKRNETYSWFNEI